MTSTTAELKHVSAAPRARSALDYLAPVGRALYALIFILSGTRHFSQQAVGYAAAQHVPWPAALVPLSGLIAVAGGLSVLLGYRAKLGAWLLVLFLVPVTLMMHDFWAVKDPMMAQLQMVNFMKNVSMLGAALLIAHFGAGRLSFDAHRQRRDS